MEVTISLPGHNVIPHMPRVLTKGTESSLSDVHAEWDQEENLIDTNIAFYDLMDLQHRSHEFAHPWFDLVETEDETRSPVSLPTKGDVFDYLDGGNDIVLQLPTGADMHLPGENRDGEEEWYEFDPLAWLPISVNLDGENRGDLIGYDEDWDWYFEDEFPWEVVVGIYAGKRRPESGYSDPRPPEGGLQRPESGVVLPDSAYYPDPEVEIIATNNVNDPIAARVRIPEERTDDESANLFEGQIYLIPPHESVDFPEFVRGMLEQEFGQEIERKPDWIDDYPLSREEEFSRRIEQMESDLSGLESDIQEDRRYREILFEGDDVLEDLVLEVLEELGLDVEGEVDGSRDGSILLDDQTFILEITGQNDGIGHGKIRELEDHLDDAEIEGYGTNRTGLLIFNHFQNRDPDDRDLNPHGFLERLERGDHKLLTTVELYQILCDYRRGDLETEDLIDILTTDESIIQVDRDLDPSSTQTRRRLQSVRERLRDILD